MPKTLYMYNSEIKTEYLNTISNEAERRNIRSLFNKSASFEELLNKDIHSFNYNNFVTLFEKNGYIINTKISGSKSIIKAYITFCMQQKYCNENSLIEIDRVKSADLGGYYMTNARFFLSIEDLLSCIQSVYSHANVDPSLYEPIQAFYGCYWYGLNDDEIYQLTDQQVNCKDCKIKVSNREILVSKGFSEILQRVIDYGFQKGIDGKSRKYKSSKYVFKSTSAIGDDVPITANFHSQKNKLWRMFMEDYPISDKYYGKVLSTTAIEKCGLFSRIYEVEQSGVEITSGVLREKFPILNSTTEQSKANAYNNRLKDYKKWKYFFENSQE